MAFQITSDVKMKRDSDGMIRRLSHASQPYALQTTGVTEAVGGVVTPRALADSYVRDVAPSYELDPEITLDLASPIGREITQEGPRLKLFKEKVVGDRASLSRAE